MNRYNPKSMKVWVVGVITMLVGATLVAVGTWFTEGESEIGWALFGYSGLVSIGFVIFFIATKIKNKVKPKIGQ